MRTMRLKKREIRDKEVLRDLIDGCSVVRIGAADEEGMFIVPVNYGYELLEKEDGTLDWKLYFHSAAQGRKAEAFAKEPVAALELDREGGVIRGDYTCSYSLCLPEYYGDRKDQKAGVGERKALRLRKDYGASGTGGRIKI